MSDYEIALMDAREAVMSAPDRQTLIEAYRYWYDLKNNPEQNRPKHEECESECGWLDSLEKYYGGIAE